MTDPQPSQAGGQFIGWLLIAVGALMVLLCGGCTLVMWGVSLFAYVQSPNPTGMGGAIMMVGLSTLLGGLPAAGGGVLIWAGWRAVRPLPRKPVETTFE